MTRTIQTWSIPLAVGMAFAVLASTGGGQAQAADMSLEFRNVEPDSNRNPGFGFSGGVWTDPSGNEDVVGRHNFSTDGNSTNPDIQGTPLEDFANDTGGNGVIAGQWGFTVTGSSGDDWDDVFASTSDTQIDISWDGALLDDTGGEVQVDEIFFSHILASGTATQGSLGTWIENNNSAATPGQTVDPVWTYLDLDSLDPLTGATGEFAFVTGSDPLGVVTDLDDAGTDAAFVSTSGTGSVTAQVPVPSSFALLCAGLAGLAAFVRGGIATGRHAR